MKLEDLGYTNKWIKYGILKHDILENQFIEFKNGEDQNTEHYRYGTLPNWLRNKESFVNQEIENFIELLLDDPDRLMAGSAVKELFTSRQLTDDQFNIGKKQLPTFGDWTIKLIKREELKKRIMNEKMTIDLLSICLNHAREFKENQLIGLIVEETNNADFITKLTTDDFGIKIRNQANQKLKQIKKADNNR